MKRTIVVLAMFVAAVFATTEKQSDALDMSAATPGSIELNQQVRFDDASLLQRNGMQFITRINPIQQFLERIDEILQTATSLLNQKAN